jgi:putative OPT family oligopeptide transporter
MLVAACNTLLSMRTAIRESIAGAFGASAAAAREGTARERTERDISFRWLSIGTAVMVAAITGIYYFFTGSWMAAVIAAAIMTVSGFLLSAVGGYLIGLVGSSNQPLSGLTLAALVLSALVMLAIGATGIAGTAAVLGVASVVACACSVSGSLIQDLKAGQLLGGTPWKMQVVEMAAVVLLSLFLMLPIIALHEANLETGGIGGRALPAPQAGLMAQLAKGIVGGPGSYSCVLRRARAHAAGCRDVSPFRYDGGDLRWRIDALGCGSPLGGIRTGEAGEIRRSRNAAGFRADSRRGNRRNTAGGAVSRGS